MVNSLLNHDKWFCRFILNFFGTFDVKITNFKTCKATPKHSQLYIIPRTSTSVSNWCASVAFFFKSKKKSRTFRQCCFDGSKVYIFRLQKNVCPFINCNSFWLKLLGFDTWFQFLFREYYNIFSTIGNLITASSLHEQNKHVISINGHSINLTKQFSEFVEITILLNLFGFEVTINAFTTIFLRGSTCNDIIITDIDYNDIATLESCISER